MTDEEERQENLRAIAREKELRDARVAATALQLVMGMPDVKFKGTARVKRNGVLIGIDPTPGSINAEEAHGN